MKRKKKKQSLKRKLWAILGLTTFGAVASHLEQMDVSKGCTFSPRASASLTATAYDNRPEEEKTLLAKILYFETYDEPGAEAVAHVIRNRYLFDTCDSRSLVKNWSCDGEPKAYFGGDDGLLGIVTKSNAVSYKGNNEKTKKKRVYEFSCIPENRAYFQGDVDTNVTGLNKNKLQKMYGILERVLDGTSEDPTGGALYYKNSALTDQIWQNTPGFFLKQEDCDSVQKIPRDPNGQALSLVRADCRVDIAYQRDHTTNIESHDFYTVRPERTETVHEGACKFVNGVFAPGGSHERWCRYVKK